MEREKQQETNNYCTVALLNNFPHSYSIDSITGVSVNQAVLILICWHYSFLAQQQEREGFLGKGSEHKFIYKILNQERTSK